LQDAPAATSEAAKGTPGAASEARPDASTVRKCRRCADAGEETVLGPEVDGDVCSYCAAHKCARKGCDSLHEIDSVYCRGHRLAASAVGHTMTCDNLPRLPEPSEAMREAWQRILGADEEMRVAIALRQHAAEEFASVVLAEVRGGGK
jgi:hypothetical protein